MAAPALLPKLDFDTDTETRRQPPYAVILHNDDPKTDGPIESLFNVKDLARDPVHRFFQRTHAFYLPLLAVIVYWSGYLFNVLFDLDGVSNHALATSWLIWGMFVRTVWVLHTTWFVNSASHIWGYRNFPTTDDSKNTWWVAALTFGEGWHNNHHAYPVAARHGVAWYEFDLNWYGIRTLQMLGLAHSIKFISPAKFAAGASANEAAPALSKAA